MNRALALWALAAWGLCAQSTPQFTWQGRVDGVVTVHVRSNRVEVEALQGAPVEVQKFRFYNRLPESRQQVEVEVLEGRGSVRVTSQPAIENNYTASVTIEDRQDGAALYSIALRWNTETGGFGEPGRWKNRSEIDRVKWTGRVDGEVVVRCLQDRCEAEARSGLPPSRPKFKFTRPMPDHDVRVSIDETTGRGDLEILEQPSSRNGHAVRVLIVDRQPGASDYSFVLSWQRPPPEERPRVREERPRVR